MEGTMYNVPTSRTPDRFVQQAGRTSSEDTRLVHRPCITARAVLVMFVTCASMGRTFGPSAGNSVTGPASRPTSASVRILLVGDSTVEQHSGWGPGFAKLLKPEVRCLNRARGGRSSKSFINEGWWKKALAEKPDYVLIQFGHNDMPGKGPARETDPKTTYVEWMSRYVDESRAIGAEPILITSMVRRHFGSNGRIHTDLAEYAEAVKRLAKEKHVPLIDLHTRSIELLDRLGPEASKEFNPVPDPNNTRPASTRPARPDTTHLSKEGADVMGKIVAEELRKVEPRLAQYFKD